MSVGLRRLVTVVALLALTTSLIYLNRFTLMSWAAAQGAIGFVATLAEPILPTQQVDWQASSPAQDSATARPPISLSSWPMTSAGMTFLFTAAALAVAPYKHRTLIVLLLKVCTSAMGTRAMPPAHPPARH